MHVWLCVCVCVWFELPHFWVLSVHPSLFLKRAQAGNSIWEGAHSALQLVQGQKEENEGMVGAEESHGQCRKTCCQVACGMLGFVCISESFVCKCEGLIYPWECVGGREAAEEHLELYENPGISTSGNRIAAYQRHTHLYAHHLAYACCYSSPEHNFQPSHSLVCTVTHFAAPKCI